ncbi:MAG: nitrite reductase small subunit NirD [Candidatus Omnitrophica bacterium]|nr:nitrite reductase small subunit NirD [Candidatus Omnitrophota bacterium]
MSGQRVRVASAADVPPGGSCLVQVDGKDVALFNVDGRFFAVGNRCPHRSGPLVRGRVEKIEEKCAVRCPLHGWLFDLESGRCLTRASATVPTFPVLCEEGQVLLGAQEGAYAGPSTLVPGS